MALMSGFARIGNNAITVLVNDAEKSSDIDPQEAQQTLEIAEANLKKAEDVTGRVVSWSSAGTCRFRAKRRATPFAAQTTVVNAIRPVVDQEKTGQSYDIIQKDLQENVVMSAKEAQDYGIIDRLTTDFKMQSLLHKALLHKAFLPNLDDNFEENRDDTPGWR
ncbi:hypothetical protein RHSIM_RhsimPtG0000900 (chloroplast) [Rhododendron simsii]|uniref:ATP-dependent Clp protease proteolytic subunit n=1 Tax=Rhododendron simsii TaxID=118357 RepID=A0A834FX91_RHOSS|nr:hypothetical protein RHSIM_RhsimPtG0000900 [Rhododendron simsii]